MQIKQDITLPEDPPSSRDRANFRLRADAFVTWIKTFATQIKGFIAQLNSALTWINEKEESTVTASAIAAASANFKGTWNALSNVQESESYVHNGIFYRSLQNSVGETPPDASAEYQNSYWAGYGATIDMINSNLSLKANILDVQAAFSNIYDLSNVTSYHLLSGKLSLSNFMTDVGFATTLYSGNGGTQSITTGVDMDTQWGNLPAEKFGGLIWIKDRTTAYKHVLIDTVRGNGKAIYSNETTAESTQSAQQPTSIGFDITNNPDNYVNKLGDALVAWNFQTTHQISGITNHGKAYTCHYNPFTGFTIVKYEGSSLVGHEIPHHLAKKLSLCHIKNLSAVVDWSTYYFDTLNGGYLNRTDGFFTATTMSSDTAVNISGTGINTNQVGNTFIMYGWANSYYDANNMLIGNYEVGTFGGTGIANLKIILRKKPTLVMGKRIDTTGDWFIFDGVRGSGVSLAPNLSTAEISAAFQINVDGFTVTGTDPKYNASGGMYMYLAVYDNDSGSGKSKYPRATDASNLNLNALVPFAQGIDSKGTKNTILSKNETITGITLTQGKNYPYLKVDGTYGVSKYDWGTQGKGYSGFGDFFNQHTNKWYSGICVFADSFDTITNWTADENTGGTAAVISSVNGELSIVNNGATYGMARTSFLAIVGKKYRAYFSCTSSTTTNSFKIGTSVRGGEIYATPTFSTLGSDHVDFVATSSTLYLSLVNNNISGAISTWDNLTIYPINNDGTPDLSNAVEIISRNYLDAIVYADAGGQVAYVEQLAKVEYKDIIKASEFQGKNACTALISFDGTTTPPTINDSVNFSTVVRTGTGLYDLYFTTPMDNKNYSVAGSCISPDSEVFVEVGKSLNKVSIAALKPGVATHNVASISVIIFGGKN